MRKPRHARLFALALAAGVVPMPGRPATAADHPDRYCNGQVVTAGGHYFHRRGVELWIYRESNGVPGLQPGGVSLVGTYGDDLCDHPNPDTLLF